MYENVLDCSLASVVFDSDMMIKLRTNHENIKKINSDEIFLSIVIDDLKQKTLDTKNHSFQRTSIDRLSTSSY